MEPVRAVSAILTIVTVNFVVFYDLIKPEHATDFHLIVVLLAAIGMIIGLGSIQSAIETESPENTVNKEKASIEAVKTRYVEDEDYTLLDMENDMEKLMEEKDG